MDVRAERFARLLGHDLLVGIGECMNDEQRLIVKWSSIDILKH